MKNSSTKGNESLAKRRDLFGLDQNIPSCKHCSTRLVFEFQVLPSLLHILCVDKYVDTSKGLALMYQEGEMNWGNIAVYTCPNDCIPTDNEEYCVIQDSIDSLPTLPQNVNRSAPNMNESDDDDDQIFDDEEDDGDNENEDHSANYLQMDGIVYDDGEDDDDDW